jgi:MerR family transcriptional regulator, copper efflux regulator
MRITEAARRLGTSPRMLRYRDSLGLLPAVREPKYPRRPATGTRGGPAATHRQFDEADLDVVALALAIERRYDISPAALAFGLRVLTEPTVRADVAELSGRLGRFQPPSARALDFEQERALRLLNMPVRPPARPGRRSAVYPARRPGAGEQATGHGGRGAGEPANRPQ